MAYLNFMDIDILINYGQNTEIEIILLVNIFF